MTIPSHLEWKQVGVPIGSGGQGTVYRVFRESDPENIRALKILNPDAPQQAKERFRREMETVSKIPHPTIIKVVEYSKPQDDFQYLVMEYHEGAKTVEEICLVGPESNPYHGNTLKCLDLFEQIIQAIRACELANDPVFHRDISPKNILILPDESIRLIDFGLCQTENNTTITMTGENVGTRSYAPPECGAFSHFSIGTHTDIYSAAKVLWSAINSARVFDRALIDEYTSMKSRFPNKVETWHLRRLFENTIQEDPAHRFGKTELVLLEINEVRHAVNGGFPPLEEVETRCPSCGRKNVKKNQNASSAFDINIGRNFTGYECKSCGLVFVRRLSSLDESLGRGPLF